MRGRRLLISILLFALLLGLKPEPVVAGAWSSAYSYYNSYGDSVVFRPTTDTDGIIYYATRGSKSTKAVRFKTLGWRVRVLSESGSTLQTIYYKLDGSFMTQVDTVDSGGYEYNLYSMSLYNLKRRMNAKASKALTNGTCRILLDACMTVTKKGKPQGSMSDSGSTSGRVYTSYSGIAGAENWSAAARQSLYSYFGKEVNGLFFDIEVRKSTGISSVSGGGHYLYGTSITASAKVKKGYTFRKWSGLYSGRQLEHSFYVNESGTMTASADPMTLQIIYHRNTSTTDETVAKQNVKYGGDGSRMKSNGWKKDGKKALGYALSRGAAQPNYALNATISDQFIWKYAPQVHLYAVWADEDDEGGDDIIPPPTDSPEPPIPQPPTPPPSVIPPGGELPDPDAGDDPKQPDPSSELSEPPNVTLEQQPIRTRFISSSYFEDVQGNLIASADGGLSPGSRWEYDEALRSFLRYVLAMGGK